MRKCICCYIEILYKPCWFSQDVDRRRQLGSRRNQTEVGEQAVVRKQTSLGSRSSGSSLQVVVLRRVAVLQSRRSYRWRIFVVTNRDFFRRYINSFPESNFLNFYWLRIMLINCIKCNTKNQVKAKTKAHTKRAARKSKRQAQRRATKSIYF